MWLVRINWLRQLVVAALLAGLTLVCFSYLVQGMMELIEAELSVAPPLPSVAQHIAWGGIGTAVFAYVAVGAFINGVRALCAGFRGRYGWRTHNIAPFLLAGLLALPLSACANKPELAHATGTWVHLNGDKYPSNQNDISRAPLESGRLIGAQR